MSSTTHFFYYALWIAHPVLQLAVAAIMWPRKLHKKFPVFFAYIIMQVAIFAILFPIQISRGAYATFFYTYWITAAISVTLGFKVIHEIFLDIFKPYHTLKDLGTVLFQWAGLVMLLVATVVAAASSTSEQGPLVQAVLIMQRCVRVIQCGLVLFLVVFSRYLGVSWKQQSFGIAAGFGSFAGAELIAAALGASGELSERALSFVIMVAYNLAILCWMRYMWAKSETRESAVTLLTSQRWDQSLAEIQYPVPADSLIPMFEGMVDRAFSRAGQDGVQQEQPVETESVISRMISDVDFVSSTPLPRRPPEPR
jgi:hypothetical protein